MKHGYLWTANKERGDGPEMKLICGPLTKQSYWIWKLQIVFKKLVLWQSILTLQHIPYLTLCGT